MVGFPAARLYATSWRPSSSILFAFEELRTEQSIDAVEGGGLLSALASLNPDRRRGPWTVLCDNESFLSTARSKEAHANARVSMWHIPPRSPDLNPIEKYWAWLRKALLARDLSDAVLTRSRNAPPWTRQGTRTG